MIALTDTPSSPITHRFTHVTCLISQQTVPELRVIEGHPGHRVSCHWAESILAGRVEPADSLVVEAAVAE